MKRNVSIFPLLLAVGITLSLTACASGPPKSGPPSPVQIESADESSITLANVFYPDDENNLRIANEHCKKFGKVARFPEQMKARLRYSCVPP